MSEKIIDEVMGLVKYACDSYAHLSWCKDNAERTEAIKEELEQDLEAIRAKLREVLDSSARDQIDAECFRWWVHEAAENPVGVAKAIAHCITEDEYRLVIVGAKMAKDAALKRAKGAE